MIKQFLKEQDGQTTVEYLLIIAVVVVVISVLGNEMKKGLPNVVQGVLKGVNTRISSLMSAAGGN